MKPIGVTLQRTYLTKTAKITIVRHPAKLSYILGLNYSWLYNAQNFSEVLCKKVFVRGNTFAGISFLIKFQASSL